MNEHPYKGRCEICGQFIFMGQEGEEVRRLAHPDAEIDYDFHECEGEIVAEPAEADPAEIKHA